MQYKKIIISVLLLSAVFALSACSNSNDTQTGLYKTDEHLVSAAVLTTGIPETEMPTISRNESTITPVQSMPEKTTERQTSGNNSSEPANPTKTPQVTASPYHSPSTAKQTQTTVNGVTPYSGRIPVFYPKDASKDKPLSGKVIGLDPGHQAKGNSQKEPNAPGSSVLKAKCTTGATGTVTGTLESEINLSVALMLKDYLLEQGAVVVMIRDTQDVDISNAQRALVFNEYKADLSIRVHCNSTVNQSVKGILMMKPQSHIYLDESYEASEAIIKEVISATGAVRREDIITSDMTGFNWCTRPTVLIEMGFLSNPEEDRLLSSSEYQDKIARAICGGTIKYFTS